MFRNETRKRPVYYTKPILMLIVLLTVAFVSPAGYAQRSSNGSGLEQAIRSIEQQTGGRVLSADKRRVDGQARYRLKVLTPSGRVRIIYIDAN